MNKYKRKKYNKEYQKKNKMKIKIQRTIHYQKNKERLLEYAKIYRENNREKVRECNNRYYRKNKDKKRRYKNKRRKKDINYKILYYLRNRLYKALKRNSKAKSTKKLLGCSINYLKKHLQKQFEVNMNWDNYGRGKNKWCIDHIRPCASFDLSKSEEQKKCFNYKNLQPLWYIENLKKRDNF